MPAPACAAPPSWGRHPQTFTIATKFRTAANNPLFNHFIGERRQRRWNFESH
jgi:hypothetical protein